MPQLTSQTPIDLSETQIDFPKATWVLKEISNDHSEAPIAPPGTPIDLSEAPSDPLNAAIDPIDLMDISYAQINP